MTYRDDIDGLRAIAVLGVVLYHFDIAGITGGFIGVDVFFVLSGYLIGGIVFRELSNSQFTFSNFYFRRIRRLFPVYVFVISITFIFAYHLMLPNDFREFGQSMFASTLYISNVLFYLEAGYFDTASELKPLLHTWSLSIEEQFYLLFPFLAWLLYKKSAKFLVNTFIFLGLLSFTSSILFMDIDSTAVFYLYPFRAWELFLGVVLATNTLPVIRVRLIGNILSTFGILLIIIPYYLYDHLTTFPGISALLPCIGTALILHSGQLNQYFIHRLLAVSPLTFLGKISYSLYLWHWPVYVFFIYDTENELTLTASLALLFVTILLSILSWKFVETPLRGGLVRFSRNKLYVFTSSIAVSLVFLAVGYFIHDTDGMPERLNQSESSFADVRLFGSIPNCKSHDNDIYPDLRHCSFGSPDEAESYTIVWGDSHAGAFAQGILENMNYPNQHLLLVWSGGCPPVFDITKQESASTNMQDRQCSIHNNAIEELIRTDSERIDSIVMIGRWSYYVRGTGYGIDEHNKIKIKHLSESLPPNAPFTDVFEHTLQLINEQGIDIYVLEQIPEFKNFDSRKHAIQLLNGRLSIEDIKLLYSQIDYEDVILRQKEMINLLKKTDENGLTNTIHTHKYFCLDSVCSTFINNRPVYFDNNHISTYGATLLNNIFHVVIRTDELRN